MWFAKEVCAAARGHRIPSFFLAGIAMLMSLAIFLSLGKVSANETKILGTINEASPRLLSLQVRTPGQGLSRSELRSIEELSDVEWILGLSQARDVRNAYGTGSHVAVRDAVTDFPAQLHIDQGRVPGPGEVIVSSDSLDKLGLIEPSGALAEADRELPLVGSYTAEGPLSDLGRLVLGRDTSPDVRANHVYLSVRSTAAVVPVQDSIKAIVDEENAENMRIESSEELAVMQRVISGQLGKFAREIAFGVMGVRALLIGLTTAMASLARRRDDGRRRALGATRSMIVALSIGEACIPVACGSLIGSLIGSVWVRMNTGVFPDISVEASISILVMIAGALCTAPSALWWPQGTLWPSCGYREGPAPGNIPGQALTRQTSITQYM